MATAPVTPATDSWDNAALGTDKATTSQDSWDQAAAAPTAGKALANPSFWESVKAALKGDPNNPGDPSYALAHPTNRTDGPMPGSFEGHPENIGEYIPASVGQLASGAVDIAHGDIAKGGHKVISGAVNALAPVAALTAPAAVMAAPITTAVSVAGGVAGQKLAETGADAMNATPDQKALAGDIGGIVGSGVPFVGASAVKAATKAVDLPTALSKDVASTLATVAHNEGLPPLQSTTAREAADEIQKGFITKAKEFYQPVDKAVGGDLKPVQEKISQLKTAIKTQANVNPDLADKYTEDLGRQYATLSKLVAQAKANGVPNAEQLMAQGDSYYSKGMAMKNVSAGIQTASGTVKNGGHPNPVLFANQIDKLYNNNGPLTRALGKDGAAALQDVAKSSLTKLRQQSAVKAIPGVRQVVKTGAGLKALGGSLTN